MMRNFWWGQKDSENKIAWVYWRKICWTKLQGGMGFRNIQAFNLAMLAKQGWRILTNLNSLMARVFKQNIFLLMMFSISKKGVTPHMLGEASTIVLRLSKGAQGGGWEMVSEFIFGMINDCQHQQPIR